MIYMYDISFGDFREINLCQLCTIEHKQDEDETFVIMASGERHAIQADRVERLKEALSNFRGKP